MATTKALRLNTTTGEVETTPAALLDVNEAATTPTASRLPRADVDGKISGLWVGPGVALASLPVAANGEVSATKLVRADDSRFTSPVVGGDLSGSALAAVVTRIQGRPVVATLPGDAQVLAWNNAAARWEPATPTGGGAALTVRTADGATTVANVATIRVTDGTLTNNGGGAVTIATGSGGGGGSSPGALLALFCAYR